MSYFIITAKNAAFASVTNVDRLVIINTGKWTYMKQLKRGKIRGGRSWIEPRVKFSILKKRSKSKEG